MELVKMTEAQIKARRSRNVALGIVLAALVIVFYAVAIVRIGGL